MSIGTVSPGLNYLIENSETCYAVLNVYRRDGTLVGIETLSPITVDTLKSLENKAASYERYLEQNRIRNRSSYEKRKGYSGIVYTYSG